MTPRADPTPVGQPAVDAAAGRAKRSAPYREARAEYAAIAELRERNPIAAHLRERRFELEMTQAQVAEAASTSHSYISRVEKGDTLPTLAVLQRILAVLDEDLLLVFEQRGGDADHPEREEARMPMLAGRE